MVMCARCRLRVDVAVQLDRFGWPTGWVCLVCAATLAGDR